MFGTVVNSRNGKAKTANFIDLDPTVMEKTLEVQGFCEFTFQAFLLPKNV